MMLLERERAQSDIFRSPPRDIAAMPPIV